MKAIVLALALTFAGAAHAQNTTPAWQQELEQYKNGLTQSSQIGLYTRLGLYAGNAIATCSASAVITGATFVADTVPLTNILGEGIANIADLDYQTYQNIWDWETLEQTGRGALGGGVVGVAESLEFVVLWLAGNEQQSFEALAKTYASTIATMDALFAEQGQCLMSIAKVALTRAELSQRNSVAPSPLLPQQPSLP